MEKILKTTGYLVKFFDEETLLPYDEKEYKLDELTKALLFCKQYNKNWNYRNGYVNLYAVTNKTLVRIL